MYLVKSCIVCLVESCIVYLCYISRVDKKIVKSITCCKLEVTINNTCNH